MESPSPRGGSAHLALEVRRKIFHCLILCYLFGYHLLGMPAALYGMAAWTLAVAGLELGRLSMPRLNAALIGYFKSIHRAEEEYKVSGMLYTALGAGLTMALFGSRPRVVDGALLFLTFGDAAAAVVGRLWGRHRLYRFAGSRCFFSTEKTLEGTLACLGACLACGWLLGLPAGALWAGAVTATALEFLPLPFNDNLWLPILTGWVLSQTLP